MNFPHPRHKRWSFSIHNRIVHRSTPIRLALSCALRCFSIHNRIVHRSTYHSMLGMILFRVSVSTIGSFIVQLNTTKRREPPQRVSVSTIGSFIVQHPKRDRFCTSFAVSVSTIGSFIVQPPLPTSSRPSN